MQCFNKFKQPTPAQLKRIEELFNSEEAVEHHTVLGRIYKYLLIIQNRNQWIAHILMQTLKQKYLASIL